MNSQGNSWTGIDVSSILDQKIECNLQISDVIPATDMLYSVFHYFILFYFLKEPLIIHLSIVFLNVLLKDLEPEKGPI